MASTAIQQILPADSKIQNEKVGEGTENYFSVPETKIKEKYILEALENGTCKNYEIFYKNIKHIIHLFVSVATKDEAILFQTLQEQYSLRSKKEIKLLLKVSIGKFKKDIIKGEIENGPEWLAALKNREVDKKMLKYQKIGMIVSVLFLITFILSVISWSS